MTVPCPQGHQTKSGVREGRTLGIWTLVRVLGVGGKEPKEEKEPNEPKEKSLLSFGSFHSFGSFGSSVSSLSWYILLTCMKRSEILFGLIRIPVDMLAASLALLVAYKLRLENIDLLPTVQLLKNPVNLPPFPYYVSHFILPAGVAFIVILACFQLYALKITLGPWRELSRVAGGVILWLAGVIAWFFLIEQQLFFSRILLLHAVMFLLLFTAIGRIIILLIQRSFLRRGIGIRTVMSCGSAALSPSVEESLTKDPRFRYTGHVHTKEGIERKHLDLVLHTDPNPGNKETLALINYCRSHHIGYAFLPPVFADVPHLLAIDYLGLTPMLRFAPTPLDGWGRVIKRIADFVFGLLLLVILSPLLLLIALIILLSCGWPIFYVSTRTGQYGRTRVPLLKFRTMVRDADKRRNDVAHLSHRHDGPLFKIKNDPRVTPIGKFLRRFSLDELPQLLNVIVGHLSLVGPRPHLPEEVAKYKESERRVFTVRPGITGLAQISGRSNLEFNEEIQLDMRYIEDWSILLDLWILWRTIFVVIWGRGAD